MTKLILHLRITLYKRGQWIVLIAFLGHKFGNFCERRCCYKWYVCFIKRKQT